MPGLKLVAELGGDGSGFERMMGRADARAHQFATSTIAPLKNLIAGVFTVGAISALVKSTVDWASKLRDVSDNLGVNVEFLQKLQNGAKLAGADIEDVSKLISKVNQSRQAAIENPKGNESKAFARMGISGKDITGLSSQKFIEKLMAAFKGGSSTQLENDIKEVGGKSARNLIGAFSTQFKNDIPILSEQLIDQLDDLGDEFTSLKQTLMVNLAPAIVETAKFIVDFTNKLLVLSAAAHSFNPTKEEVKDSLKENAGNILAQFGAGPLAGILETAKTIFGSSSSAGQAALDEEARQRANAGATAAATQATKDARHRRENSAPDFNPLSIKDVSEAKSDARVRIGAFMGTAPNSINSISMKHIEISRQQLSVQRATYDAIKRIADRSPSNSLTIEVPSP